MKDLTGLNSILEVLGTDMWGGILGSLRRVNPYLFHTKAMSGIGVGPKKRI
jgi:hypothetical protein